MIKQPDLASYQRTANHAPSELQARLLKYQPHLLTLSPRCRWIRSVLSFPTNAHARMHASVLLLHLDSKVFLIKCNWEKGSTVVPNSCACQRWVQMTSDGETVTQSDPADKGVPALCAGASSSASTIFSFRWHRREGKRERGGRRGSDRGHAGRWGEEERELKWWFE